MMECGYVLEMADSFVTGELLPDTNELILGHLDCCPRCRRAVASRRALRVRIRQAFERHPHFVPREQFGAELRARLRQTALGTPARPSAVPRWLSLAAILLLTAGLAASAWMSRPIRFDPILRDAVGDHRNCALRVHPGNGPLSLEEAARRFDPSYRTLERWPPDDLGQPLGAARILARHACRYDGRLFAHLIVQYRGTRVSLSVTDADPRSGAAPRDGWSRQNVESLSVAATEVPGHAVVVVGALEPTEMDRFVDLVAAPLADRLAGR